MILKFIRLIIAGVILIGAVILFITGSITLGVFAVLFSGIVVLSHFKNEKNMLAFYYVRKQDLEKAGKVLATVKRPELMVKSQEAYYYYLNGMIESQKRNIPKAEKLFKTALKTGLRMKNDQAVAKLNLAAISLSKRDKRTTIHLIQEVKKLDKQKMLTTQIREIEDMMKRI